MATRPLRHRDTEPPRRRHRHTHTHTHSHTLTHTHTHMGDEHHGHSAGVERVCRGYSTGMPWHRYQKHGGNPLSTLPQTLASNTCRDRWSPSSDAAQYWAPRSEVLDSYPQQVVKRTLNTLNQTKIRDFRTPNRHTLSTQIEILSLEIDARQKRNSAIRSLVFLCLECLQTNGLRHTQQD